LTRANVQVVADADQPAVLREADVFVTHHGVNSTHEAIFCGVPMLSYPFFWDQPDLAAKCQELGLAVPLCGTLRGRLGESDLAAALASLSRDADDRVARLRRAREHELEVIAGRDGVLERILDLASRGGGRCDRPDGRGGAGIDAS
jgi:UDP:flavonoid glycosyltransferase YjiC (YdhE family)